MNDLVEKIDNASDYTQAYESLDPFFHLRKPLDFEDKFLCIVEGRLTGTPCPVAKNLSFRAGEVTLWGGINGHGKSLLTGQVALQLADIGEKPCVISLEMQPERTLIRMARQWLGHYPQNNDEGLRFLNHYQERLLIFDYVGSVKWEILFGAITIAAQQRLCQHIFIDNMMKCVGGEDDFNAQKEFIQVLCTLARQLGIHIHLVHHVRKGKDENEPIGKFSFKGSGAIVDQVDNAILIQRNRWKEQKANECYEMGGRLDEATDCKEADSVLRVVKQRNGDWEGDVSLWFDRKAAAYCLTPDRVLPWRV